MQTLTRDQIQPDRRVCRTHRRPAVFAIVGRDAYVACDVAGCVQDAEASHRLTSGPGYLPTVRYEIVPARLTDADLAAYRHDPVAATLVDPTIVLGADSEAPDAAGVFLRLNADGTRCQDCRATYDPDGQNGPWSFWRARNGRTVGRCGPCGHDRWW